MTDLLDRLAAARPPDTVDARTGTEHERDDAATPVDALRHALRPNTGGRRPVDRGLAGGLRAWLEDGVAALVADRPANGQPLVVDRWAAGGRADRVGKDGGNGRNGRLTVAAARQAMVGRLFRQLVSTGTIGRPFADAVAGLRVDDWGGEVVRFVSTLPRSTRQALRRDVDAHGAAMAARWPALPPNWLPRTTVRLCVPLAGGRVLLRTSASLALGMPPVDRASHCLVDVRAGGPHEAHAADRRFLALVETLRCGAPPCRVATWYPTTGSLDAEDPCDGTLAATVPAVLDVVLRLAGEGGGRP